jgi:hypothetical protein
LDVLGTKFGSGLRKTLMGQSETRKVRSTHRGQTSGRFKVVRLLAVWMTSGMLLGSEVSLV